MKSLFYTLLIIGSAFAAYDYFLAKPWERVIFEKGPRPAAAKPTIPDHVVEGEGPISMPVKPASATTKVADTWQPTVPKLPTDAFTPPAIPSAESVTQNWKMIPKQAFPRPVKLNKDVPVQMSFGSSILKAGVTATAVGSENGMLMVAPTPTSPARGRVAVLDTDFPDQIHVTYEKWKVTRIEEARQAWLNAKTRSTSLGKDKSTMGNGLGITFGAEGKPTQNPDGSYNLLLAVLSTGRVTDVDPNKVVQWHAPELRTVDGKPTWVIDVRYLAKTVFGPMEVDSHAHVRDGQLLRWIYDSGEPLP